MAKLQPSASLIDLDALPPEVRRRVEYALSSAQSDYNARQRQKIALQSGSDAELLADAEREYPRAPMGLSTWYKSINRAQWTCYETWQGNRRPVFMRGSKSVLIRMYCNTEGGSSPNGWATAVYWRAVRMSKRTILDYDDFEEFSRAITSKLRDKYHLTSAFWDSVGIRFAWWKIGNYSADTCQRLIGGRVVELTRDQLSHIRSLQAIIKKADRLDDEARRALVRQNMMERLAA